MGKGEFCENFIDADDFIDCFNRGCEAEFLYDGKRYWITHNYDGSKKVVMDVNNEDSRIEYDTPNEALNYPIGDKKLADILQDMKVIDRLF